MVGLGELLSQSDRQIDIYPGHQYKEVTVRLWGKGVVLRKELAGAEIAASRRNAVQAGQFILSRIDARNGASGLVPESLDGAVVSSDFPSFDMHQERLLPSYLSWLSKTAGFIELCRAASEGTTNRVRLKEDRFLRMEIPLPPLPEQRRIVGWLDAVATRAGEAKRLIDSTSRLFDDLSRSVLWSSGSTGTTPTPVSELVRLREPDVAVSPDESYDFAGVYCFGRGVFRGQTKSGVEFKYPRLTRLQERNFVYPKLMAWEGALGVVPPECDGLVVSTEFPVFEIDESKVLPEVLDVYFRTPSVWPELSGSSTGTNVRRRRLNPKDFLRYRFPLPQMQVQRQIREIKARTDAARAARGGTMKQLDAVVASAMNAVFAMATESR